MQRSAAVPGCEFQHRPGALCFRSTTINWRRDAATTRRRDACSTTRDSRWRRIAIMEHLEFIILCQLPGLFEPVLELWKKCVSFNHSLYDCQVQIGTKWKGLGIALRPAAN